MVASRPSCPAEPRDKSSPGESGRGLRPSPEIMSGFLAWRKEPERPDNPVIFTRSGRKSQVTLCRNSSEPQPGVCGSSCQQAQPLRVAQFCSPRDGTEDAGPGCPARACTPRSEPLAMKRTTATCVCVRRVDRAAGQSQEVWTGAANSEPPVDLPSALTCLASVFSSGKWE